MSDSIYMATSGALCNQQRLEILSNNLANINTTGFKEEMAYIRVTEVPPGVKESLQNTVPTDTEPTAPLWQELESRTVFSQGGLRATGSPLDLAIDGEAFFCVQTPEGVRYTRNGSFTRSAEGELTTHDGFAVLGESGPIQIDDGRRVTVDETGNVSVDGAQVAKLRLVELDQSHLLQRLGGTLFAAQEDGTIQETPSETAQGSSRSPGVVKRRGRQDHDRNDRRPQRIRSLSEGDPPDRRNRGQGHQRCGTDCLAK